MKRIARQLYHQLVRIEESRLPAPVVTWIGGRTWRLEADYSYQDGDHRITVPAGFEFDLSSIPRLLWWLVAPFELSVAAPLLHDFLYRYRGGPPGAIEPPRTYTRAEVDALFGRITEQEGVAAWRRALAYLAVRLFGRLAWGQA